MIFKSVDFIKTRNEKKFFLEYIDIYIRLIEVFCEKENIEIPRGMKPNLEELYSIGVINQASQITLLKKIIGKKYQYFLDCVAFSADNKAILGNLLDKLYNSSREKIQECRQNEKKPTLVDFFCGAGGLSLGFIQEGFQVILANDIEDVCIETYKYNHPDVPSNQIIQGDIKEIVEEVDQYINSDIDIIVGGPPCQGFSEANRQRVIDDPRNKLYKYFVKAVEVIGPKFVVMENVQGMLKVANQVVEDYARLKTRKGYSYKVAYRILNSQNFSVAQSRDRLIYIAIRNDIAEDNKISPIDIFNQIEEECINNKIYNLKGRFQNLPFNDYFI